MGRDTNQKNLKRRYETRRLLYSGCEDEFKENPHRVYDPNYHPADVIAYFKERYEAIDDPIRYRTDKGALGFVTKPVRPPTQAAYAAKIGVRRETLWAWEQKHDEFSVALGIAKAFQEALLVELGAVGALAPSTTNFILKNLQGWTDKIEETHKGSVALQFDAQDSEA
jgi:DNA-binding XRE family transcriptional regulator